MACGSTNTILSWSTTFSLSGTPIPSKYEHLYKPIPRKSRSPLRTQTLNFSNDRSSSINMSKKSARCYITGNGPKSTTTDLGVSREESVTCPNKISPRKESVSTETIRKTETLKSKVDLSSYSHENSYSVLVKPRIAFASPPRRSFAYTDHAVKKKTTDVMLLQRVQSKGSDILIKERDSFQNRALNCASSGKNVSKDNKKHVSFERRPNKHVALFPKKASRTDSDPQKLPADTQNKERPCKAHSFKRHLRTRSKEESALECPCQKPLDNNHKKSPPYVSRHKPRYDAYTSSNPEQTMYLKTFKHQTAATSSDFDQMFRPSNVLPPHNQGVASKVVTQELFQKEHGNLPSPIRIARDSTGSAELPRSSSPLPFRESPDSFLNISSGSYLHECVYSRQLNPSDLGDTRVLQTHGSSPKGLPDNPDLNTSDLSQDLSYVHSRLQEHSESLHNHSIRLHDILDKANQAIQARHSLRDSFSEIDRVQSPLADSIHSGDDSYFDLPSARSLPFSDEISDNKSTGSLAFSKGMVKLMTLNTKCASTSQEARNTFDSRYVFQPLSHQELFRFPKDLPPSENTSPLYKDLCNVNMAPDKSATDGTSYAHTRFLNTAHKSNHDKEHSTGSHSINDFQKESKPTKHLRSHEPDQWKKENENIPHRNIKLETDGTQHIEYNVLTDSSIRTKRLETGCENPVYRLFDRQLIGQVDTDDTEKVISSKGDTIPNLILHHTIDFSTTCDSATNHLLPSDRIRETNSATDSVPDDHLVVQQKTTDDSGVFEKSLDPILTHSDRKQLSHSEEGIISDHCKINSAFFNESITSNYSPTDNPNDSTCEVRESSSTFKNFEKLESIGIHNSQQNDFNSLVKNRLEGADLIDNSADNTLTFHGTKDITIGFSEFQNEYMNTSPLSNNFVTNSKEIHSPSRVLENSGISKPREIIVHSKPISLHTAKTIQLDPTQLRVAGRCLNPNYYHGDHFALYCDQMLWDPKNSHEFVQEKEKNAQEKLMAHQCDTNSTELLEQTVLCDNESIKQPSKTSQKSIAIEMFNQAIVCDDVKTSEPNSLDLQRLDKNVSPKPWTKGPSNPLICEDLPTEDLSQNMKYFSDSDQQKESTIEGPIRENVSCSYVQSNQLKAHRLDKTVSHDIEGSTESVTEVPTNQVTVSDNLHSNELGPSTNSLPIKDWTTGMSTEITMTKEQQDQNLVCSDVQARGKNSPTMCANKDNVAKQMAEELPESKAFCAGAQIPETTSHNFHIECGYDADFSTDSPVTKVTDSDNPKLNLLELDETYHSDNESSEIPQVLFVEGPGASFQDDGKADNLKKNYQSLHISDLETQNVFGDCNYPSIRYEIEPLSSLTENVTMQSSVPNDFEVGTAASKENECKNHILCECLVGKTTPDDATDGTIFTDGYQAFQEEADFPKPLRVLGNSMSFKENADEALMTDDEEETGTDTDTSLVVSVDRPLPRELLLHRLFLSPLRANYFDYFRFFGRRPLYNASFESSILRGNPNFLALAHFHVSQDLSSGGAEEELDEFPDSGLYARRASDPCLRTSLSELGGEGVLSVVPVNPNRIHRRTLSNLQDYASYGLFSRRFATGRSLTTAQTLYRVMCHIFSKPEQPFIQ